MTQSGTVKENVENEIKRLSSELQRIAEEIRAKVNLAGEEAKETWKKLESERERFTDQVEQTAEETRADLTLGMSRSVANVRCFRRGAR